MSKTHTKTPVITLDGPSGTGKGTISQMLATHLGWNFLDSGAIYRVLAYAAEKKHISINELDYLIGLARALDLFFVIDKPDTIKVLLDDVDVTEAIRTEQCGQNASKIAALPTIREALLARQRAFAKPPGLVTDGRDMGTVVFPNADLKIYLYASTQVRASRRHLQLKKKGIDVSLAQVVNELTMRDQRDSARECAPLKPATDAVLIDTTRLDVVQVFDNVLQLVNKRLSIYEN